MNIHPNRKKKSFKLSVSLMGNKYINSQYTFNILKVVFLIISILTIHWNIDAQKISPISPNQTYYEDIISYPNGSKETLYVDFLNIDNDESNFEEVHMSDDFSHLEYYDKYPVINGKVKHIRDYVIWVYGEDEKKLGEISFSQVLLDNGSTVGNAQVIEDLRNFAKSEKNNKAVAIYKSYLSIKPEYNPFWGVDMKLRRGNIDTTWIEKAKTKMYNFGSLLDTEAITTSMGKYTLAFYSNDDNDEDCERIYAMRNDGTRFIIDEINKFTFIIETTDGDRGAMVEMGAIVVSWPEVGQHIIFDNELFMHLSELAKNPKYAKALKLSSGVTPIALDEKGRVKMLNRF